MIAFEVFSYFKKYKAKKNNFVGIKMNMFKAYDRIKWNFIYYTLLNARFPKNLTENVMKYVTITILYLPINAVLT